MRLDKLTTKFQEALADAQSLALGRPRLHPARAPAGRHAAPGRRPHALAAARGRQRPGPAQAADEPRSSACRRCRARSRCSPARDLIKLLQATEKEAIKRGDQFIASEMFLLALADAKGEGAPRQGKRSDPQEPGSRHRRRARRPDPWTAPKAKASARR
jgi:ATP-dependent Clp protease ATP-binding subunit ClpB